MKIGNIEFSEYPLFLAPMEDVTDISFRKMCKKFGADLVYTEFVSADALIRNIQRTEDKMTIDDSERPTVIQLYGKDTETIVEAAKIAEAAKPDIIDINFGCPVKKIAGKGGGAGLLRDIPKLLEITREVVKAVKLPVTVKTRLGWDSNNLIITTLAEQIQDCGAQALAIHGRTRAQMYTGEADWTLIGEVKNNPRINIPIIGNGDVTTPERAKECFDKYGVDAVMIGRATFGRPWIFKECKDYIQGKKSEKLNTHDCLNILKQMIDENIEMFDGDERKGITHTRRHLASTPIFKGIDNFRKTRIEMLRTEVRKDLFDIIDSTETLIEEAKNQQ